jgi:hypothetical protein
MKAINGLPVLCARFRLFVHVHVQKLVTSKLNINDRYRNFEINYAKVGIFLILISSALIFTMCIHHRYTSTYWAYTFVYVHVFVIDVDMYRSR